MEISAGNTIFVIMSFEGPDVYSSAGGLGTRVNNLAEKLAKKGFETHLFFVGDPDLKGYEAKEEGRYILHRWCQWISRYHRNGVYDGEDGKVRDFSWSVPEYIVRTIFSRAKEEGKKVVVMAEEWQTADALMNMSDRLYYGGMKGYATLLWNANNVMSFHRINWGRLAYTAKITAVSRFMKHILWQRGLNPVVVPNGIPDRLLKGHDGAHVTELKKALKSHGKDMVLLKIGRYDPAKRWRMAVEAVARLKEAGVKPLFLIRGGIEPHGGEIMELARERGLSVGEINAGRPSVEEGIELLGTAPRADVLSLKFFLPETLVQLLYHCCDGVLANSGFEPFGLVGLEVMAAGGIAFTGATGEDYVVPMVNAISVETDDPNELTTYLLHLQRHPELRKKVKAEAHKTAKAYSWDRVVDNLLLRIEFFMGEQGGQGAGGAAG
ncbi:MAG: glycosyltransferase family 4 protein [bacterium]